MDDEVFPLTVLLRIGGQDITMTVTGRKVWHAPKGETKRVYFDYFFTPRSVKAVSQFYEILSGPVRASALIFETHGREFVYEYDWAADTRGDRLNVDMAMEILIENIAIRDQLKAAALPAAGDDAAQ